MFLLFSASCSPTSSLSSVPGVHTVFPTCMSCTMCDTYTITHAHTRSDTRPQTQRSSQLLQFFALGPESAHKDHNTSSRTRNTDYKCFMSSRYFLQLNILCAGCQRQHICFSLPLFTPPSVSFTAVGTTSPPPPLSQGQLPVLRNPVFFTPSSSFSVIRGQTHSHCLPVCYCDNAASLEVAGPHNVGLGVSPSLPRKDEKTKVGNQFDA